MMKKLSVIAALVDLLLGTSLTPSNADEYLEAVQVSCIPEIPHFAIRFESFHSGTSIYDRVKTKNSGEASRRAWRALEKRGYLNVRRFNYSCRLPSGVFRLEGETDRASESGMCGGAPMTFISLFKDNEKIIDGLPFKKPCLPGPYIGQINIEGGFDTNEGQKDEQYQTTLMNDDDKPMSLYGFKYLDREYIECLIENKAQLEYKREQICAASMQRKK